MPIVEPLVLEANAATASFSNSEHRPVEVAPSGRKFTFWIICGVLLPLITIGVELATRLSAESWVDPMPTTAHVVLALLVPLINLVVAIRIRDPQTRGSKRLAVAAGFSTGISALYALIYLPFAPVSLILMLFIIGLLPAAPTLNMAAVISMGRVVWRVNLAPWAAGILFGLFAVVSGESWAGLTHRWMRMAASTDQEERASAANLLRWFGSKSAAVEAMQRRRAGIRLPWSAKGMLPFTAATAEEAQRAFFLMTGESYSDNLTRVDGNLDWTRGGMAVGTLLPQLGMSESWMVGSVSAADRLAVLNWTMTFNNRNTVAQEARSEVVLPAGAVVSSVSLWINGEERPAAFGGSAKVRTAYQNIVAARRDPLLVTWRGKDRVMVQCFPVPALGSMKIKLGITVPVGDGGQFDLPQFNERNFAIDKSTVSTVDIQRPEKLPAAEASWVMDGDSIIRQWFEIKAVPRAGKIVVVLDGSAVIEREWPKIRPFLKNAEMVLASDRVTLLKETDQPMFRGGMDNGPALLEALNLARGSDRAAVVWIHGPQPVEPVNLWELQMALGNSGLTEIHSLQVKPGWNVLQQKISSSKVKVATVTNLEKLMTSLEQGNQVESAVRQRVARPGVVPTEWGPQRNLPQLAALWAAEEVERLPAAERVERIRIGSKYRVITEATGAVVLETAQDYERAGLKDPDDPEKPGKAMEGTPEPATWLTMGAGLAILFAARRKLKRANA